MISRDRGGRLTTSRRNFIKAGAVVKVGIEGLGEQEHEFLAYKAD